MVHTYGQYKFANNLYFTGYRHKLKSPVKLAATLREQNITTDLTAREKEFETLFKHTSKASSYYDTETEEMTQLVHQVKDKKVTN